MSERMIELQRKRLLAAGKGSRKNSATGASSAANGGASTAPPRQTPQQAAAAAMLTEDQLLDRFIQRLHQRDDSRADSVGAPTVPTALSRRLLHKQGVGYLDGTVGAVVSAAGDRFLATVLQQTLACRNERLKGAALVRSAARTRQRHWEQYEADVEYRRKRKLEVQEKQTQICHNALKAAESLKKFPPATNTTNSNANDTETPTSKKKKKKTDDGATSGANTANGSRLKLKDDLDEEASINSLDEEEAYHRDYFGDVAHGKNLENDDEDDDIVILRDLSRPLQAWGFHVTGKHGLQPVDQTVDSEDESDEEESDDAEAGMADSDEDDAGDDDDADEMDGKMTPVPKSAADKKKSSPASDSKRKSATSPAPTPVPTELSKD